MENMADQEQYSVILMKLAEFITESRLLIFKMWPTGCGVIGVCTGMEGACPPQFDRPLGCTHFLFAKMQGHNRYIIEQEHSESIHLRQGESVPDPGQVTSGILWDRLSCLKLNL